MESTSPLPPLVLLVDDSVLSRRIAASLLSDKLGLRIVETTNGAEALELLKRESPALVLTDIVMPDLDGLQLVQEIRSLYPRLPVVLMTAHGSEGMAMRALQAGAASYVPKRMLNSALVSTIESVLASAQKERRRNRVLECVTRIECDYELESDPALVPPFIAQIQEQIVRMSSCNANTKIRIGVALEEALLNGIYHGNLELSSDLRQDGSNLFNETAERRRLISPYRERRLHVQVRLSSHEASFVIRDEGPGFDVSKLPDPTDPENLLKTSGRGLLLIRTFMDEAVHNPSGNQITLVKRSN